MNFLIFLLLLTRFDALFARYLTLNANNQQYCSNKFLCETFTNTPNEFDRVNHFETEKSSLCEACDFATPIALKFIAENKTEHVIPFIKFVCQEFKIESPAVCDLVIKEYAVSLILSLLHY